MTARAKFVDEAEVSDEFRLTLGVIVVPYKRLGSFGEKRRGRAYQQG